MNIVLEILLGVFTIAFLFVIVYPLYLDLKDEIKINKLNNNDSNSAWIASYFAR